eukprot:TRINITY_DN24901_c0_g1_i1.p1 TRINITY_DN24901_c0_g1~~TRINITY_DN24901_c0_g1_i1.p1  ORF type:complete len:1309 (-),score=317.43 TRINITY_DN24901_c0_g1_i1:71-3553(-)
MMNYSGPPPQRGLIPRTADGLYGRINELTKRHETREFLVVCSFLEIYNEVVFDLLVPRAKQSKGGLDLREAKGIGVYVDGLTEVVVESAEKLNQIIERGFAQRCTAATRMNNTSSRSHCIFIVKLHQKDKENEANNTFSKLNLVDLAGSERAKSTEAEGDRLKEGANINKSLSALGNVINALSRISEGKKKVFVPYRNSKLTRLLQESLGGNSLCTMVAAISPSSGSFDETLSTLMYARRAKMVKVSATKNDESQQIKKLQSEVETLRKKLQDQAVLATKQSMDPKEREEIVQKWEAQINELQSFLEKDWEEKARQSKQYEDEQQRILKEKERAEEGVRVERRRRLDMLARQGDLKVSVEALKALGRGLCRGWPERIQEALKLEQELRTQLHAVRLYRESAGADFELCQSCGAGGPDAMAALMGQMISKLSSMASELQALARLEGALEKAFASICPDVALALREAELEERGLEENERDDLVDNLKLVQRQLAEKHARTRVNNRRERWKLGLMEEMRWLTECLRVGDGAATSEALELLQLLRTSTTTLSACEPLAEGELQEDLPGGPAELLGLLGLSTFELPDECLSASSNAPAARCARMGQSLGYGGWCPETASGEHHLEINLNGLRRVTGVSLQGRNPCTGACVQTRDLLEMALPEMAERLPHPEGFVRPPVRLLHDVCVALVNGRRCFGIDSGAWEVPPELLDFDAMSREQKQTFFDEIITRARAAVVAAAAAATPAVAAGQERPSILVTPQEILAGRNGTEVNRLLQLLAFLSMRESQEIPASDLVKSSIGGLLDFSPQWTTKWKLSYQTQRGVWSWYGTKEEPQVLDGCSDASTVCHFRFPEILSASRLRFHAVEWHVAAAFRCEVHVVAGGAPRFKPPGRGSGRQDEDTPTCSDLESSVEIVQRGVKEVQRGLLERERKRRENEVEEAAQVSALKNKAELERDDFEKRLQEALAKIEELEQQRMANEQRVLLAENTLMQTQVEKDRLSSRVEQLEKEVVVSIEACTAVEDECQSLQTEVDELASKRDELLPVVEVVRGERDHAREKEEELFERLAIEEDALMESNAGYVQLTELHAEKDDEMCQISNQEVVLQEETEELERKCSSLQDEWLDMQAEAARLQQKLRTEERMQSVVEARYEKLHQSIMMGSQRKPVC